MMLNYHLRPAIFLLLLLSVSLNRLTNAALPNINDFLLKGDRAISQSLDEAINHYTQGLQLLPKQWTTQQDDDDDEYNDSVSPQEIEQIISLHTNYATALSFLEGSTLNVANAYRTACICYRKWKKHHRPPLNEEELYDDKPKRAAVQSFFFLGMTYQDLASSTSSSSSDEETTTTTQQQEEYLQQAVKAYASATKLDPNHWSSYANMGVVLADVGSDGNGKNAASLLLFEEGILSYQKAIELLLNKDKDATDPPENVMEVVSELNYRIGLCLVPFLFMNSSSSSENNGEDVDDNENKLCALPGIATDRSCFELAAYQFHTALQSGHHEGALNALTLVTADATFGMSTDVSKVQQLFEEYAASFEGSLVDELKYNGFHRMRRIFDRVMVQEKLGDDKKFELVLDVGCGTGLAGVEFRNISSTLVGIDISPKIIEQAKRSHPVYDEYRIGDVRQVLQQYSQTVSLLVAADTFIYFNDLSQLFAAMKDALEEGGYAIFSLENVSKDNGQRLLNHKPEWRWQITPSGRIAHRKEYVEAVARQNSFEVVLYDNLDGFRREKSADVPGHVFVLRKLPGESVSNDEL